jgi:hypothetical protein
MTGQPEGEAGREIARDLEALGVVTSRDIPGIHDTASAVADRAAHLTREGWLMKGMRFMKARPWMTTAAATAALAAVLLVVPVSYQRTVGHDVTLSLAGTLDHDTMKKIAGELKTSIGADKVRMSLMDGTDGPVIELSVASPSRSGREVRARAAAFAKALESRGIHATAEVAARREKVSTNMYAYAMDQVVELRIDRAGRSPAEIEADIRSQLEAAGIENPSVSVTQEGDQTKIQIEAHDQDAADGGEREFRINLAGDGTAPMGAKLHQFEVHRTPGMSDADVKADIERQMREAGVEGTVTVEDGKVEVKVEHQEQH